MKLLPRPVTSSLGSKYVMAVTGLVLIGFVIVHMSGNLLIYAGPDALNGYAEKLKSSGPLLWIGRLVLLVAFLVHIIFALRLNFLNAKARPVPYYREKKMEASWASRHMMLTGLVLLAFILYHLAHFTFGVAGSEAPMQVVGGKLVEVTTRDAGGESVPTRRNYLELAEVKTESKTYTAAPAASLSQAEKQHVESRHDVYSMTVNGFRNVYVSTIYMVAMIFLGLHLWHGGSSWLQSLGINAPAYKALLRYLGPALAVIVVVGNCSMPIYVMLRFGIVY